MSIKTYSELSQISTFEGRYNYLKLFGKVGDETFGFDRLINQMFYKSVEWKRVRDFIIVRDNGCDLGIDGHEIYDKILIHHMNPISIEDIKSHSSSLFDTNYLISTSQMTHNAIHYGNDNLLSKPIIERKKNDTCLWAH